LTTLLRAFAFMLGHASVLASMVELQDGSFGCPGVWKNEGLFMALLFSFYLTSFREHQGFGRLGNKVTSGDPSSSSSPPTFMYVNVPDPMPEWLVKYSILTYFVPPVASFLARRR
jgi:hypothetical protein